jgi:hypothetical protein
VFAGYEVEVLVDDLTFATVVEVAEDGTVYVGEAGFSYGGIQTPARLLRIADDVSTEVVVEGNSAFEPTDATFDPNGETLYVTHFGVLEAVPGGLMPVPETGALIRIRRLPD